MSAENIWIPTSYVVTLLKEVADQGYDTGRLLESAAIEPAELEQHPYFSGLRYGRLYQEVRNLVEDEWFGMLSGGKIRKGTFRIISLLMVNCKTLRQALIRAWEFGNVCTDFRVSIKLVEQGDIARVRLAPLVHVSGAEFSGIIGAAKPVKIRTTLAAWKRHWTWLIGSELPVLKTHYTFPQPDQDWEMAQFSSAETVFGTEFNGFDFPASFLDYAIIQNEATLQDYLPQASTNLVVNVDEAQSTTARIKAMLNQNVGQNMMGAERVAERLNMSVTTLRRHLQIEGTTYQRLKDECRKEAALHYLASADLSNQEIAERLGFEQTSAFFRAFKKWTGTTPRQYRLN